MSEIRNCSRADLAAVAALFQKTFRDSGRAAPRSLEDYLAAAYFEHPWFDPDIAARVHVNEAGRVTGFVGIFPSRLLYRDKIYRAAIAGSLMVEYPEREPLAGAKLLRSVIRGPQDISISETTNLLSQRLWEPLGGHVVPSMSLDWFNLIRPATAALAAVTEKYRAAALLSPFAHLGDRIGRAWLRGDVEPRKASAKLTIETDPSEAAFAAAIKELSEAFQLGPAWSEADIAWLLSHAARKERYGALHTAIAKSRKGEVVGCYIYHGRRSSTGRVLQVLAKPGNVGDVVDALFDDAERSGLAGLRGRVTPQLTEALLTRNCVYLHRASTMIYAANAELVDAVKHGDALITGLAGESWTRLVGGEFD